MGALLQAFGARVLVADPQLTQADLTCGEQLVSLEAGLAEARVISLHAAAGGLHPWPRAIRRDAAGDAAAQLGARRLGG